MSRVRQRWLVAGGLLLAGAVVAISVAPGSALGAVTIALASIWLAISLPIAAFRLWRWMTYRVGVRLFLSYLLLGIAPFLFCGALALVGLYILMGQYTSVRFGDDMQVVLTEVSSRCAAVRARYERDGADRAVSLLAEFEDDAMSELSNIVWLARFGTVEHRTTGAEDLSMPGWLEAPGESAMVVHDDRMLAMVSSVGRDGSSVVALLPITPVTARVLSEGSWYQVAFPGDHSDPDTDLELSATADSGGPHVKVSPGGAGGDVLWGAWQGDGDSIFDRPWIIWFRLPSNVRSFEDGAAISEPPTVTLLRTAPSKVWNDFILSRYELASSLQGVMVGMAAFFLVVYGAAVLVAGSMIVSITRSTSRLSRGADQVASGNLDHRIQVRRNDQLGDLAASFNSMTASVQSMLTEVGEKQRLAHELELAREIQRSLLPAASQRHGAATLFAAFRPATEVGGDYFDVFPLGDDTLLLAVGDIAGHGLPTGLLMATLKASLAALVDEGYRGSELVLRVNRVLRAQRPGRTMATLAVVEVDLAAGRLVITNAGHPPPLLVTPDADVREIGSGAIPLGSPLCQPSRMEVDFPPGSQLTLYSDGVVEAADPDGEPFGYVQLAEVLTSTVGRSSEAVVGEVLRQLDEFTGPGAAADDVTILVLEHGPSAALGA